MATKTFDLVARVGQYKDAQGNEKVRWQTIGAIFEGDKGPFMVLEPWINTAGLPKNDNGALFISMFKPDRNRQGGDPHNSKYVPKAGPVDSGYDENDQIPF